MRLWGGKLIAPGRRILYALAMAGQLTRNDLEVSFEDKDLEFGRLRARTIETILRNLRQRGYARGYVLNGVEVWEPTVEGKRKSEVELAEIMLVASWYADFEGLLEQKAREVEEKAKAKGKAKRKR